MSIRITCGASTMTSNMLVGQTVAAIRQSVAAILGVTPDMVCTVNGVFDHHETCVIGDGNTLTFKMPENTFTFKMPEVAPPATTRFVSLFPVHFTVVFCGDQRVSKAIYQGTPTVVELCEGDWDALGLTVTEECSYRVNGKAANLDTPVPSGSVVEVFPKVETGSPNEKAGIPSPYQDLAAWKAWRRSQSRTEAWPPTGYETTFTNDDPEWRQAHLAAKAIALSSKLNDIIGLSEAINEYIADFPDIDDAKDILADDDDADADDDDDDDDEDREDD